MVLSLLVMVLAKSTIDVVCFEVLLMSKNYFCLYVLTFMYLYVYIRLRISIYASLVGSMGLFQKKPWAALSKNILHCIQWSRLKMDLIRCVINFLLIHVQNLCLINHESSTSCK